MTLGLSQWDINHPIKNKQNKTKKADLEKVK